MKRNLEKNRKYQRDWYYSHKDEAKAVKNRRKQEIKQWFKDYKATLVCECGENHPACLSFHHPNDDKTLDVATLVGRGYSIKRILLEIAKCEVKCENCHRKDAWNRFFAGVAELA